MINLARKVIIFVITGMIASFAYSADSPTSSPTSSPTTTNSDDLIRIPLPAQQTGQEGPTIAGVIVPANGVASAQTVPAPVAPVSVSTPTELRSQDGTISFYFQNISIKSLLQLIAKNSGLNFIISDNVKGDTTLNLKNVTWHQALDIILHSNGLGSRQIGSAMFISTLEDISQKQTKEYQAEENAANMAPLVTAYIPLSYADADVISKVIRSSDSSLLTQRGTVSINVPTNSIIVRDVRRNLNEIRNFVRKMDIPARQVSIEARLVNIDTLYEAQLGVRFGLSNSRSLSGTLAGASQLANGTSVSAILPIDQRLNFDLPANLLSNGSAPGSIGLALARLGPVMLDLELSALEEDGHIEIISKPRVVTANQQKAMIQTGEEIPYQNATSSGATATEFKKAVLSLEIIPQITPDDKIILKLKATQDTRGPQLLVAQGGTQVSAATTTTGVTTSTPAVFGPPTINTQEVQSFVVLNDNETVVIGGVYKLTKSSTFDRVPFFGSLPIIGGLFRHRGIKNEKTELLIFLTPKIIRQQPRIAACDERLRYERLHYKGEG